MLSRDYGFESKLLLNPTRYDLVSALDELRNELGEDDNLLIYYAGHGFLDRATDEGYWLPVDAEADSRANWVSVRTVTTALKGMAAKHVLVVADSCYSGKLPREAPALGSDGPAKPAELRRIAERRTRRAMTSGDLEPVDDGGGDGHSVFARAFLETLRGNQQVLDGHRLYTRVREKVVSKAEQTPQYSTIKQSGDEGGDFIFVPVGAEQQVTVTIAPAQPAERAQAFGGDRGLIRSH